MVIFEGPAGFEESADVTPKRSSKYFRPPDRVSVCCSDQAKVTGVSRIQRSLYNASIVYWSTAAGRVPSPIK